MKKFPNDNYGSILTFFQFLTSKLKLLHDKLCGLIMPLHELRELAIILQRKPKVLTKSLKIIKDSQDSNDSDTLCMHKSACFK